MTSRILLMRHAQIDQSLPRRFVGQRDLPLDEQGLRQAESARTILEHLEFARVVSSDLRRAMATAEIVCQGRGVPIDPEPALREIKLGLWEGLSVEEVCACFPGEYELRGQDMANFRPAGGESFQDILNRVWPVFEFIAATAKTRTDTLIVAHAGVIRVLLCRILGMPLAHLFRLRLDYCGLSVIENKTGEYYLERMNLNLGQV